MLAFSMNTKKFYIGIMSGTSLDGVDFALCEIDENSCNLLSAKEYEFTPQLKKEVLRAIEHKSSLRQIGELDVKLGRMFSDLLQTFLVEHTLKPQEIHAVGLHGQTLWHNPDSNYPFSMQLGDPNIVAQHTGITTVADFRRGDIALGGEGAPFAPAFHQFLYGKKNCAVVNIGGMANITFLGDTLQGWDSGCGNVLLDYWVLKTQGKPFEKDGEFARDGEVHQPLLEMMLSDQYFTKEAPKSTGREYFNAHWLQSYLQNFTHLNAADVQRTLLELTATTIANDVKKRDVKEIILCGGGAKNLFLLERIEQLSSIKTTQAKNSDALEAMAFAYFAYKRLHNEPIAIHTVTGAKKDTLLGAIYG